MSNLGEAMINIAVLVVCCWLVNQYWECFYFKKPRSLTTISAWLIFLAIQIHFQNYRGSIHPLLTVLNIVSIYLVGACCFESKGSKKYFLLVLFFTVWGIVEILVYYIVGDPGIEHESLYLFEDVLTKIIMSLIMYVVTVVQRQKRGDFISTRLYLYLLFIPAGSGYIAIHQFRAGETSMLIAGILLLFNVVIFELYIKINDELMREKEKAVYAQQIGIVAGNTAEQQKMMEDFYEERHNLVNELIVLHKEIENDNRQNALNSINEIIRHCHYEEVISQTGNRTIDAVINFKYAIAREKGIAFHLKIFVPEDLPIARSDLGVILGNAIDNAMEAVEQCVDVPKEIDISIGVKKESWILVIKNPYTKKLSLDQGGRLLSTKKEKHHHGYGLKSIMKIAEKYQGETLIQSEDGMFTLTVILSLKNGENAGLSQDKQEKSTSDFAAGC